MRNFASYFAIAFLAGVGCSSNGVIGDIYMALDDTGVRRRTQFFTDTLSIYCISEYASGDNATTVNGVIRQTTRYNEDADQMEPTNRVLSGLELVPGKGATRRLAIPFTKRNDKGLETVGPDLPYPAGKFVCEMTLDGKPTAQLGFAVNFAPCPDVAIVPNSGCRGFFKKNAQCPKYGASSKDGASCTCEPATGNWACDKE